MLTAKIARAATLSMLVDLKLRRAAIVAVEDRVEFDRAWVAATTARLAQNHDCRDLTEMRRAIYALGAEPDFGVDSRFAAERVITAIVAAQNIHRAPQR